MSSYLKLMKQQFLHRMIKTLRQKFSGKTIVGLLTLEILIVVFFFSYY